MAHRPMLACRRCHAVSMARWPQTHANRRAASVRPGGVPASSMGSGCNRGATTQAGNPGNCFENRNLAVSIGDRTDDGNTAEHHGPAERQRVNDAIEVFPGKRALASGAQKGGELFDASHGILPTEEREQLEEAGTGRSASQRDARGVNQRASFEAQPFRGSTHRAFHM
jgi:hypothetical protein